MQILRVAALVLSLGLMSAYAQQEVDPDHFDQSAAKPAVHQVQHSAAHRHNRQLVASKHAAKKNHSRHAHTSA